MTAAEFRDVIARQTFRRARTERNPHYYVVKSKTFVGTDAEYDELADFISKYGFKVIFWNVEYTVFQMGQHFYWTIGGILNCNNLSDYVVIVKPRWQV